MSATRISQVSTRIILPQTNEPATPTLAFGDGDSGIYEMSDDTLRVAIDGTACHTFNASSIYTVTGRSGVRNAAATATTPNLVPSVDDLNTGIGAAAADQLSLIAGGVEGMRITAGTVVTGGYINSVGGAYALALDNLAHTVSSTGIQTYSSFSGAGVTQIGVALKPTLNQTTTSAFSALTIQPVETAVGSGQQSLLEMGTSALGILTRFRNDGVYFPVQAVTASAPTYAIGAIYFDTTLNKLRVGGAAAWETVTSA